MSAGAGIFYFVLLLLAPIAFTGLMVYGVVRLTLAENKKLKREETARLTTPETVWQQPQPADVLLEIHISKGMTLWGLFLCVCLIGFGLAFMSNPVTALVLGWWTTFGGLIMLFKLLGQLSRTRPMVVLTTSYIEHARWPFKRIPWCDIRGCYTRTIAGKGGVSTYLCIEVEDQNKYLRQMNWLNRSINKLNWLVGCSAIHFGVTPLKINPSELVRLIQEQIRSKSAVNIQHEAH